MKAITYDSFMRKSNCGAIVRWIMELSCFHFTVWYREGRLMDLPDALSRLPSKSDELYAWWVKRCEAADRGTRIDDEDIPGQDSDDEECSLSTVQRVGTEVPMTDKGFVTYQPK